MIKILRFAPVAIGLALGLGLSTCAIPAPSSAPLLADGGDAGPPPVDDARPRPPSPNLPLQPPGAVASR